MRWMEGRGICGPICGGTRNLRRQLSEAAQGTGWCAAGSADCPIRNGRRLGYAGGYVRVAMGTLVGVIAEGCAGTQGFGYDPVFFVPELGRTLAELTAEEKNRISHRAKAFRSMADILRSVAAGKL